MGGSLILLKSILASLAFLLGLCNFLTMSQIMGWMNPFRFSKTSLRRWHKIEGVVILAIFLFVAYHCFTAVPDAEWSPRVIAHAGFGGLALLLILVKFIGVHFWERLTTHIVPMGVMLFAATVGILLTSALPYWLALLGWTTPISY